MQADSIRCSTAGCGFVNLPNARFCGRCGAPMGDGAAPLTTGTGAMDPSSIPPLPENATPDQKEEHWYKYVYQGDNVKQLTLRAVLMGGILGSMMSISNLYTTMQLGWAFGVAITACVLSYVVWNLLRAFPLKLLMVGLSLLMLGAGITGAFFGLTQIERLAKLTGGRTFALVLCGFVILASVVILILALRSLIRSRSGQRLTAMSILENNCMQSTAAAAGYSTGSTIGTAFGALLLITGEHVRWYVLLPFTFFTAMLGVFLAIPMKRQMINIEQLAFPSGMAAAETLRSLYSHGSEAMKKAYSLIMALFAGALIGLLRTGEELIPWLDRLFFEKLLFGWRIPELMPFEREPATKESPHRLAYGFEPSALLIAAGMIVGPRVCLSMLAGTVLLYTYIGPMMRAMDVEFGGAPDYVVSIPVVGGGTILHFPRWALWGGTAVMVFSSRASIALQWKTIARSFGSIRGRSSSATPGMGGIEVPTSWLIGGLIPVSIGMVIVQYLAFKISIPLGVVAVLMSFVVSLVCCRATGETDTTPIGAMGKVTQLLYALLAPKNTTINLMTASVTANAGSSSADLLTDLKSGYLLGANPRKQFIAQFCGVFFGTAAVVPAWYLMVPNKEALEERFALPSTQMWKATAELLTKGISSLPTSAVWAICIGAIVGVALPTLSALFPRANRFIPSAMGLGLSWVMPFANAFAFAVGAVLAWIWSVIARRHSDVYTIPVASGLIAGESLMSAAVAIAATITGWVTGGK